MISRIASIRTQLAALGLPALLVTGRENIFYLSGFDGSAGYLIITEDRRLLLTDFRYQLQVAREAPDWEFVLIDSTPAEVVCRELRALGVPRVAVEADHLTLARYQQLGGEDSAAPYRLVPVSSLIEQVRQVKDAGELAAIREAARVTDLAYQRLLDSVAPGVSERELALEAEWEMRRQGAEAAAFDIIVASGPHCALPHARPCERILQDGDMVVVDMGARVGHYCADMTRTFAVRHAESWAREIYRVCLEAHLAGLQGIRAGQTGREADALVRRVIDDAGYGEYFGHGTGHGVGLEVHESPRLSRTADDLLPAGAVVTVEPGIYLPDFGGVRIEDLCLLTDTGLESYTGASKPDELPIIG